MKTNLTLQKIIFKNQRTILIVFSLFLAGFEVLMHWFMISSSMAQGIMQFIKIAPPAMRRFFLEDGMGMVTVDSLLSMAYTHPFILFLFIAFPALFFQREVYSTRVQGTLALILSRPISRRVFFANIVISNLLFLMILSLSAAVGIAISYALFEVTNSFENSMLAVVNLFLLAMAMGSISGLISIISGAVSQTAGWTAGIPLTFYLLEFLGKSMKQIAFISPVNPFHYYNPQKIIASGELPAGDVLFLAGVTFMFTAAAFVMFERKDV